MLLLSLGRFIEHLETDTEFKSTGLRLGEKQYEEVNDYSENMNPTTHIKNTRFVVRRGLWHNCSPFWPEC